MNLVLFHISLNEIFFVVYYGGMDRYSSLSKFFFKAKNRLELAIDGNRSGVGLFYFENTKTFVCANVQEACSQLGWNSPEVDSYIESGIRMHSEVISRTTNDFPEIWNSEVNLSIMLYVAIRLTNAQVVVETGVANGVSTNMIMAGLEFTGGALYSFDVDENCGNAFSGPGNWNFNVLSSSAPEKNLLALTEAFPGVDLWLHDSDHSYWWQNFEYKYALSKLNPGGYLFSDDIDYSTAWAKFAPFNFSRNIVLFDFRKLSGVARNGAS